MTATPNMGLVLPTDHGSSDQWDLILDTAFGVIDSHNHTPGLGALVPMAGLKVDADLSFSFGGNSRAITDLKAIDFAPQAAVGIAALAGALFLNSADSELYYRTVGGTNVKLTAGAALNVAGFTGGIGGDYPSVGALVVFDDGTDSYWFQQQVGTAVRQYARMRNADVDLYEYHASGVTPVPTNRVRLSSPAGLAASYALTFPAALPGITSILQVDTGGLVTASNALFDNVSLAVNKNVTVSGTGLHKHGSQSVTRSVQLFDVIQVSGTSIGSSTGRAGVSIPATCNAFFPCPVLPSYARILFVTMHLTTAVNTNTGWSLCHSVAAGGGTDVISTFAGYGSSNVSTSTPVISGGAVGNPMNQQYIAGQPFFVNYFGNAGPTFILLAIEVTFDIP